MKSWTYILYLVKNYCKYHFEYLRTALELFIPLGCGAYPPIELGGAPPPTGGLIPPWPGIGCIIGPGGGGMEAELEL